MRHDGERRHADMLLERRQILRQAGKIRVDLVADPARQRPPPLPYGRHAEQRVIQAAQPQAHHQQHRQFQRRRQIRDELRCR